MDILKQYKKQLFAVSGILIIIMIGIFLNIGRSSEEKEIVDAFQSFQISFKGIDESGVAEVLNTDIEYDGKNEATQKLLDGLVFDISKEKGLSNGDEVIVKLRYSQGLLDLSDICFKENEKVIKVSGLASSDRQKVNSSVIVKDKEGNDVEVQTEHFLIDGVEIPTYWNLSDEEIQAYVNSVKQNEQNPTDSNDSPAIEDSWIQGESDAITERQSADFLSENYLNNAITTYNQAYQYGIESSQEFKVEPIMLDMKVIGYRCIFKENVGKNQE